MYFHYSLPIVVASKQRFFSLMGTVFGFVSSDVKSKIEILEEFRKKENYEKFATFNTMLNYEKTTGLLNKSDYVSGSRTLLRLHRGLGMHTHSLHSFISFYGKI